MTWAAMFDPPIIKPANATLVRFGVLQVLEVEVKEALLLKHLKSKAYTASGLAAMCNCEKGLIAFNLANLARRGLIEQAGVKINRSKGCDNEVTWRAKHADES